MIRLRSIVTALIICGGLSAGAWGYYNEQQLLRAPTPPTTPVASFSDSSPETTLRVTLLQKDDDGRRIVVCFKNVCRPQAGQPSDESAVFDGSSWYYYSESVSERSKLTKQILQRQFTSDTKVDQIIETTPLTDPRELIMSPNNQTLAFFLDNIDTPEKELTELWVYDTNKAGIRVIAEKLFRPDIRTRVRWNESSTLMWFVADTAPQEQPDALELIVATLEPPGREVRFKQLDGEKLLSSAETGVMDIDPTGKQLAYSTTGLLGRNQLHIVKESGGEQRVSLNGTLAYAAWIDEQRLVYIVQTDSGFTFWQQRNGIRQSLGKRPGILRAAHLEPLTDEIVFVAQEKASSQATVYSFPVTAGSVTQHAVVSGSGDVEIIHVQHEEAEQPQTGTTGGIQHLADEELVAFVEKHLATIVGKAGVTPLRMLVTQEPNTLYVDYTAEGAAEQRILLTVRDAVHTEWLIKARYEQSGVEWKKTQGGTAQEPQPARLYEWESGVKQWILKRRW